MFEVTGNEVQQLDDVQLRTLVARLAIAELDANSLPISGVTAGGDQNAADGGLDVRVEVVGANYAGDFIPRVPLGFQVKKPDMGPAAITAEMRPKDVLRPVLGELADANGAYVIVSSQGSVADIRLQQRRTSMADAISDHPSAHKLHVDFYDRERLATWINKYPGVAAWVKARIGRPTAGWQTLGDWSGVRVGGDGAYIADDSACLVDARTKEQPVLTIIDGINCIRGTLSEPGQCVRLIGMSGVGKTRLVQALFESDIGADPLDPSLAIYTDYSETPNPTAKQLALHLVEIGQRAILVVDNCNPQTHSDLAKICGGGKSHVSLITVEYDVQDDELERTEVFRLQAASDATLTKWLKANFPHVSRVDGARIAEFSGGNFRVAGVLAETVKKGDSLGNLRNRELFARIFQQRNSHNDDLLKAAEALALVYSFDGEDTSSDGELAAIAPVAGVDATRLYEFVAELKRRAVVQSRGRWRALLPHAIANRLAAQALERVPPHQLDTYCAALPPRLQKSLTRRLGYLHDSEEAKAAIKRWLDADGPLGDLLAGYEHSTQCLRNIAPVAPEAVLDHIEEKIGSPDSPAISALNNSNRWQFAMILKSLAFDPPLFDRATKALAAFVSAERPDENHYSVKGIFEELFHLHLSGTQALPDQRRRVIQELYDGRDIDGLRCGNIALRALLQSGHFSSTSSFDFGARPRDYGWHPATYGDSWNWYIEAINLAVSLSRDTARRPEIRSIVGESLRGILGIDVCLTAIEAATQEFLLDGEWIEGWLAIRTAIRFDGDGWRTEVRERVVELEAKLRPSDPLNVARAYICEGRGSGYGLVDGDTEEGERPSAAYERLEKKAEAIGRDLGAQPDLLEEFLPQVLQNHNAPRAFSFGIGLSNADTESLQMWEKLKTALLSLPGEGRGATVLGGFIRGLSKREPDLAAAILDQTLTDPEMAYYSVYLQAQAGIDDAGIERLRKLIADRRIDAWRFNAIANGAVGSAPQRPLARMLDELSALDGGTAVALEILHMALHCLKTDGVPVEAPLFEIGHLLLMRTDHRKSGDVREYRTQETIKECHAGPAGERRARDFCKHVKQLIADGSIYTFQIDHLLDALFQTQPLIALDEFLGNLSEEDNPIYDRTSMMEQSPLEKVEPDVLWSWADVDPVTRYPIISRSLTMFETERFGDDRGMSPLFVTALERAPDRKAFLDNYSGRIGPNGWSGNLSTILDRRRSYLEQLANHSDPEVRAWIAALKATLQKQADAERERESEREESFE